MSEYEDYVMRYGAPTAQPLETQFQNSLALMEGDRVLGGTVHGKGMADRAKAMATAGAVSRAGKTASPESLRDKVLKDAQKQYQAALEANKAAEAELKAGYKARREEAVKSLEKTGGAAITDVNAHFDGLIAKARNQMNASGIGQTTIATTTIAGLERERAKALQDLAEKQTQQKVGIDSQLSGDELQFAERVNNSYPDMKPVLAAAQLDGQGNQTGLDAAGYPLAGGGYGGASLMGSPYGAGPYGFNNGGGGNVQQVPTGGRTEAEKTKNRQLAIIGMRAQRIAAGAQGGATTLTIPPTRSNGSSLQDMIGGAAGLMGGIPFDLPSAAAAGRSITNQAQLPTGGASGGWGGYPTIPEMVTHGDVVREGITPQNEVAPQYDAFGGSIPMYGDPNRSAATPWRDEYGNYVYDPSSPHVENRTKWGNYANR